MLLPVPLPASKGNAVAEKPRPAAAMMAAFQAWNAAPATAASLGRPQRRRQPLPAQITVPAAANAVPGAAVKNIFAAAISAKLKPLQRLFPLPPPLPLWSLQKRAVIVTAPVPGPVPAV